ncbi:hypothetical protein PROFUN_03786 [Planoprotostelium fungivorum]|uniref:Uncharacterized protein n=1 Tax=Planoprotostelium fungivorum TaxID=1890364 RepID=A0A2P6NDQ2_9EUKA|nr:hypothetical protein PROFUN_03786 [Planoprotostelium fungivorum]
MLNELGEVFSLQQFSESIQRVYYSEEENADALPGLGTAILRTPQPRQTLACLPCRVPRKVSLLRPESNTFVYHLLCGRPEDIQFSARKQYWPYISRSFVGLTPDNSPVTSHRQLRDNSVSCLGVGPKVPKITFEPLHALTIIPCLRRAQIIDAIRGKASHMIELLAQLEWKDIAIIFCLQQVLWLAVSNLYTRLERDLVGPAAQQTESSTEEDHCTVDRYMFDRYCQMNAELREERYMRKKME